MSGKDSIGKLLTNDTKLLYASQNDVAIEANRHLVGLKSNETLLPSKQSSCQNNLFENLITFSPLDKKTYIEQSQTLVNIHQNLSSEKTSASESKSSLVNSPVQNKDKESNISLANELAKKINFEIETQNELLPLYMKLAGRKHPSKAFKPKYEFNMTEEDALNIDNNS